MALFHRLSQSWPSTPPFPFTSSERGNPVYYDLFIYSSLYSCIYFFYKKYFLTLHTNPSSPSLPLSRYSLLPSTSFHIHQSESISLPMGTLQENQEKTIRGLFVRISSIPSLCMNQISNSDHHTWKQEPLLTEHHSQPPNMPSFMRVLFLPYHVSEEKNTKTLQL